MDDHHVIIIGISSDIGTALAQRWLERGWKLYGTYRTQSLAVDGLINRGADLIQCDISQSASVAKALNNLKEMCPNWDAVVMCPATLSAPNLFNESSFDDWEHSINLNFMRQMQILHGLLPSRRINSTPGPCVLFFSGGGINDAPTHASSYIVSKIATIKMAELLDAEIPDTRFVTIGPGWVKTKIHDQVLNTVSKDSISYQRTLERFNTNNFTPIERVLDCCDWAIEAPREVIGGRNINVVHDGWYDKELTNRLINDRDLCKLRKYGTVIK